ncbi:MAG: AAA family ATPase [Polyangiaceae bacterium]
MSDDFQDVLAREGRELTTDRAATLPKTYGRLAEVEALARALVGKKSAVLLGPPGVGKTAVIKKLLHYIRTDRLPGLGGLSVFEISTVGLVSNTRYTGMQEDKIAALLRHSKPERIMYVSDLWNITTAGSYDTNPRGVYDLMRSGIENETLVVCGEMSAGRWEKLCREWPMLERDFATITVAPTNEEETRDVLVRTAADLGSNVMFEKSAIERVYSLTRKFLPAQSFPGKGVDMLRRLAQAYGGSIGEKRARPIDDEVVETEFGKQTGLPMHMISPRVTVSYDAMRDFLTERVLGQAEAVRAVADVLALYKTGLSNPDRPAGVLLFVGPTGVGKTELAKATAEFLFGSATRIFRVDLSEYKDYHSFEKLIGNPRGNTVGLLTGHVRQNPFTVILLDEFEKGHQNVADLFLQVFDDGRLTDSEGETVGFHHALIILTSNVGSDLAEIGSSIGFAGEAKTSDKRVEVAIRRALENHYRPEFLNRIDRILVMRQLRREDLRRIARRELGKIYKREGLIERDLLLEVDDGVIDLLLEKGTDPKYGARPLKRAMEELLVIPLARALLSAESRRFQLLRVVRDGEGVDLTFEETDVSRRLENLERRTRASDGEGRTIDLSLADVRRGLGDVYERLARLDEAAKLDDLKKELEELQRKGNTPAFWEDAFGHSGVLVRQHRISVEIQRLTDLRGQANLVRELCEASFQEGDDAVAPDLTHAYAKLLRKLSRAEREVIRFKGADHGDARILVSPAGAKEGAAEWAETLADMYANWSRERGYDVEQRSDRDGARTVDVLGAYAYGYLKGERGTHRLILPPPAKTDRRGETFLARVDVVPADGSPPPSRPHGRTDDPPVRTYDMWRSRGVRDRRTGQVDGDARAVLSGRIDRFIEAFVDDGAGPTAEGVDGEGV